MASARKLPSGNFRVNLFIGYENGKRKYKSFTSYDKKIAEYEAAEYALNHKEKKETENITVGEAIDRYIDSKDKVLSPSTIKEYKRMRKNNFTYLLNVLLNDVTNEKVQIQVNELAKKYSPKTTKNNYGLLSATFANYIKDLTFDISLPQKKKTDIYIPTQEQIILLLDSVTGTPLEIPFLFAAFLGLRRSETCALTWEDINFKNNTIKISKAVVLSYDKKWIVKEPKTFSSNRILDVPSFVMSRLEKFEDKKGTMITITPNNVSDRFYKLIKDIDFSHFRFHDLRHYNASIMLALNIPDKYAMERMGHSTNTMLKTVYQHVIQDKQKETSKILDKYFETMQHEMQHEK